MSDLEHFSLLKKKVLQVYCENFPYYKGSLETLSSKDILNLLVLVEEKTNQRISEKWVYTHLKPSENKKLPRKDMLDILAEFSGYKSWEEFCYLAEEKKPITEKTEASKSNKLVWVLIFSIGIAFILFWVFKPKNEIENKQQIEIKDEFTKQNVNTEELKVTKIENGEEEKVSLGKDKIELKNTTEVTKVKIESPFYEDKEVALKNNGNNSIFIKPNDYAMVLKAFMKADIKNWETRKKQLNFILAEDLEVIMMLKNNLGAEIFNKEEFSQKLIIPTSFLKTLEIVEVENDSLKKINFIRIIQH
jgi:hypothetical protein